ncbi:Retrovirus-related Pol polyprotein from transposon TNT 1-94 [Araneus ventricosus]|uniref:Retrovirus-related Pol polyprotein from transposon TNT 1-94 n=1 Tax=Araneus ventricosus TaxID=182803 RepID=A0A4Y2ASN2_ARAVE|nr:Retrovirus-related Pol polyprotein from transposon TNT 1-94 [Araneus ventricosus]
MSSLIENETWTLEELAKNSKAIPCKWVYKIKKNPDGSIDKYKARLVAKGFTQRYGIDYEQTYSPVTKIATVRSILSIAANERMHLTQFDVCSAFLYGKLDEAIYMQQPEGYSDGTDRVYKLKRSLYGLKLSLLEQAFWRIFIRT